MKKNIVVEKRRSELINEISKSDEKIDIPDDEISLIIIQTAEEMKDEKKYNIVKFVLTELKIRSRDFDLKNRKNKKSFLNRQ